MIPTFLEFGDSGMVLLYFLSFHSSVIASYYVRHCAPLPLLADCAQCCGDSSLDSACSE